MNLYPYQEDGAQFLIDRDRAFLADEMGLGKTVQAIVAARQSGCVRTLVVAPASALPNWRREKQTWYPGPQPWGFVSYTKLMQLDRDVGFNVGDWDVVIADEAHYMKSPGSKRTKATMKVLRAAKRAWLLSGTPTPNHPGEFWSYVKYLWPEVPASLGLTTSFDWLNHFTKWYATAYDHKPYAAKNVRQLRALLAPMFLRRRLAEVGLDLPPLRVDVHLFEKDPAFESVLEQMQEQDGIDYVEEALSDEPHLSRLRRFLGSYKAPKIAKLLIDELQAGEYKQIVVMAYHHDTLDALNTAFTESGISVCGFRGGASESARQEAIDSFTAGEAQVFLAQQTAAGVAINLQVAHEIVLVEPAWTPEDNRQAVKRIHRIGTEHPCRARLFAVDGTLDDAIMTAQARKLEMIEETIG